MCSECHVIGKFERMIFWIIFQNIPTIFSSPHIGYPWGTPPGSSSSKTPNSPLLAQNLVTNYDLQQHNLLTKISTLPLDILSDYLPHELSADQSLYYTLTPPSPSTSLVSSHEYSCSLLNNDENKPKMMKNVTENLSLSRFQDLCFDFNVDWWSYQWCSEKEVKQYHIESKRRGKYVKNPEWSLGRYDFTDYERDEHENVIKVIQYFSGGQICHENNHHRSSEVGS